MRPSKANPPAAARPGSPACPNPQLTRSAARRIRIGTPMAVVTCLLAVTAILASLLYADAKRDSHSQGVAQANRISAGVLSRVQTATARLEQLASTVGGHWSFAGSELSTLAGGIIQAPALGSVTLIRRLPGRAPEFAPAKASAAKAPAAIDDPAELRTMIAAAGSGHARATPPLRLPGAGKQREITTIYAPIYRGGEPSKPVPGRLRGLLGFISASYRFSMVQKVLDLEMPLSDPYSLRDGSTRIAARGEIGPHTSRTIAIPGKTWTLTVGDPPPNLTLVYDTLLTGLALALVLGALSAKAAKRERDALAMIQEGLAQREVAESALVTAETRFRTAFAEAPIGMALLSLDGAMLQVNRALTAITGHSEQELLQMSIAEITHPDDRHHDELASARLRDGSARSHNIEKRLVKRDGGTALVSAHTALIRGDQDSPPYLLAQIEDITARRRYEERLQHMADHDPLTGLLNRRAFEHSLNALLAEPDRTEPPGAVLLLDLDAFKEVNDTLGHSAGDELIVRVAAALTQRLRAGDLIARLGGDEFAILLAKVTLHGAQSVAEALLDTVRLQRSARGPGGRERPVTASIGIAPLPAGAALSAEEILTKADLAMYDAKEAGHDRAETYGGTSTLAGPIPGLAVGHKARIEARLEWVERIRAALDDDHLDLLAQPVVDTTTGHIAQFELLLRMRQPDGSLLGPTTFLPVAERYGLIRELDRWVVTRAVAMLQHHKRRGQAPVVEINLSGSSLTDRTLAEHIGNELALTDVDPSQLIFEVTETAAISNIEAARDCAARLGELGCRFALDDFGAGFGSFYYIKHLPFQFLKIDGEFIRSCTTNSVDRLVIQAVVDLARGLGKRTIAEFVSDHDTMKVLASLGVDYSQGFHLGRPAPLSGWLAYVAGQASRPDIPTLTASASERAARQPA